MMRTFFFLCLLPLVAGCASLSFLAPRESTGPAPAASAPNDLAHARQRALETPREPYWSYRVAEIQAAADSLSQAEEALHAALVIDPRCAPALGLLSRIEFRSGRHEAAIERLAWVETESGAPAELRLALAAHVAAAGDPGRAARLLPSGTAASSVPAYVLLKGDDPAAAAQPAKEAVQADPESAVRQNNYGITQLQAGDPRAARETFLTAHRLDPALPGPLYNLAIVDAFYLMDRDAGRDWFEKYRRLASEDPDGLAAALAEESASQERQSEP